MEVTVVVVVGKKWDRMQRDLLLRTQETGKTKAMKTDLELDILTTTLRSTNQRVLAKLYEGEATAKTFANRTQANNAVASLLFRGIESFVIHRGRPFFVVVPENIQ